jgi:hypothetical protein
MVFSLSGLGVHRLVCTLLKKAVFLGYISTNRYSLLCNLQILSKAKKICLVLKAINQNELFSTLHIGDKKLLESHWIYP